MSIEENFTIQISTEKIKFIMTLLKILDKGIPMPSIIEISNSGICNRKCSFCPRSDPNYNHAHEFFQTNYTIN